MKMSTEILDKYNDDFVHLESTLLEEKGTKRLCDVKRLLNRISSRMYTFKQIAESTDFDYFDTAIYNATDMVSQYLSDDSFKEDVSDVIYSSIDPTIRHINTLCDLNIINEEYIDDIQYASRAITYHSNLFELCQLMESIEVGAIDRLGMKSILELPIDEKDVLFTMEESVNNNSIGEIEYSIPYNIKRKYLDVLCESGNITNYTKEYLESLYYFIEMEDIESIRSKFNTKDLNKYLLKKVIDLPSSTILESKDKDGTIGNVYNIEAGVEYDSIVNGVLAFYAKKYKEVIPVSKMEETKKKDPIKNLLVISYSYNNKPMYELRFNSIDVKTGSSFEFVGIDPHISQHEMYYVASFMASIHYSSTPVLVWANKMIKQYDIMQAKTREDVKETARRENVKHEVIKEDVMDDFMNESFEPIEYTEDEMELESVVFPRILTEEVLSIIDISKEIYENTEQDINISMNELCETYLDEFYENTYELEPIDMLHCMDYSLFESTNNKDKTTKRKIDDDISGEIVILTNKGYEVKYSCSGHDKTFRKNDTNKDGVLHNKLYSTARIIFNKPYWFDDIPKGWEMRPIEKRTALYVTPRTYNEKDGTTEVAFEKWKREYMSSLQGWIQALPDVKKLEKQTSDKKKIQTAMIRIKN